MRRNVLISSYHYARKVGCGVSSLVVPDQPLAACPDFRAVLGQGAKHTLAASPGLLAARSGRFPAEDHAAGGGGEEDAAVGQGGVDAAAGGEAGGLPEDRAGLRVADEEAADRDGEGELRRQGDGAA